MSFTCPECGSRTWGSSYNFDGPGDTPIDPKATGLDHGGRSTQHRGTWTRHCHGYGPTGIPCGFTWQQENDVKYGLPAAPSGVTGMGTT